jgi:hypothetical protein
MTRHDIILKISHYQWLMESSKLTERHIYWITKQIQELESSLAQFHPQDHPLMKERASK